MRVDFPKNSNTPVKKLKCQWNFKSCLSLWKWNCRTSSHSSCAEAELRNFTEKSMCRRELRNFKSQYMPCAEAELRKFKSCGSTCGRASPSVFNTSLGTLRMLMNGKSCLIPILSCN